jgi:hypothetical protein
VIDLDDSDASAFLHSGCALLVGTIGADGLPRACRAWGLTVVDADRAVVRVLVEDDDPVTMKNIRDDGRIAVTATSVSTHRSVQLKGRVVTTEEPTADDDVVRRRYTDLLVADIIDVHRYSPAILTRWARSQVVACTIDVTESFDQTPGPSAGSVIDKDNR